MRACQLRAPMQATMLPALNATTCRSSQAVHPPTWPSSVSLVRPPLWLKVSLMGVFSVLRPPSICAGSERNLVSFEGSVRACACLHSLLCRTPLSSAPTPAQVHVLPWPIITTLGQHLRLGISAWTTHSSRPS